MRSHRGATRSSLAILLAVGFTSIEVGGIAAASGARTSKGAPFLSSLGKPRQVASTVPANGDINPYGIVVVPTTVGRLIKQARVGPLGNGNLRGLKSV
jgi:hypothetical protein